MFLTRFHPEEIKIFVQGLVLARIKEFIAVLRVPLAYNFLIIPPD